MPGLRPTPDRVRETLFNWLGQNLTGVRAVDLFAGSGILGIEALSRGASMLWAIEQSPRAAAHIVQNFSLLGVDATRARVWPADALAWLRQAPALLAAQYPIDLVFLDPPFAEPELLNQALLMLSEVAWLAADARIYVECSARGGAIDFPGWVLLREGRAGESRFMLWRRADDMAEPCA
jgi:16S rRNA (guanine966-N2)-methyltransferase